MGRRKGEREEKASTQKHKPSQPAPPAKGKERNRKEENGMGVGGVGKKQQKNKERKYIRIIQSGKKSRWFLFLPTTKCTETIGHKRVKLPNPSHVYDAQTPGRGGAASTLRPGGRVRVPSACYAPGQKCICRGTHRAPCPAELPTRSCPP